MTEQTCNECGSTYDSDGVNIPEPVPHLMCSVCGTQLTQDQVDNLPDPYATPYIMQKEQPE
jgi:DNA-directed RNA polymerase subunit RPC12/RpoP